MTPEIDFAKVAASVIEGQINNALSVISKGIKGGVAKILGVISKDLTKYTAAKIKKCSFIRTPIINRDHSVYIYDVYVPTSLEVRTSAQSYSAFENANESNKGTITDEMFISNLKDNDSIVVTGSAGSGKSMLMRHLFLTLCDSKRAKIPLFFELRDINALEKKTLQEFFYQSLIGELVSLV